MSIVKQPAFLDEYLLNKLKYMPKVGEFPLNFSDISYDASSYITENFYEYIDVSYKKLDEMEHLKYSAFSNFNMMNKDYICSYTWIFRDRLLNLLKDRIAEYKKSYKMDAELKEAFSKEKVNTDAIDSVYKEWKIKQLYSVSNKSVINFNRHYGMIDKIRNDLVNLNLDLISRGLPTFILNPRYKKDFIYKDGKKIAADYMSFRIYNDLALTKNDIEKGADYYKNANERMRSEWIDDFIDEHDGFSLTDLGDMSANFPNLLYCIKNGVYLDKDFHTEIAEKYGIERRVAKLASVACCFNQTKKQVIYHIIKEADAETKELFMKSGMISEKTGLLINRNSYVDLFHEWLKDNAVNEYMRNSLDMLTSWEACHDEYANDLCNADLCEFSSIVEMRVIIEAYKKGFIIYNAYDHGYCFNGNYDWKGEYKRWAEEYAIEFNRLMQLDRIGYRNPKDYCRLNLHHFANKISGKISGKIGGKIGGKKKGKRNALGKRNAAKDDVFNYVIEYGIDEAQRKYGWDKNNKAYWNRRLKKYNAEHNS